MNPACGWRSRHTRRRIVYCHTHPSTPEAPVGTKPEDIPEDLFDAANDELMVYSVTHTDIRRSVAAAIDWLRDHPAEAARLLGWEHDFEFSAFRGDAARVRRVLTGPWERA
jgi:hypothetical protein